MTAIDALLADFAAFTDFMAAYDNYQNAKIVTDDEDSYWTDMEALEMGAAENDYYKGFMH
jgi:hypothetical protein